MLNRLQFSIDIEADKVTIWEALWNEQSYRDWVSVFFEGSYAITNDWKEGSKVLFLAPDQSGIYSIIETHIPNRKMGFKHIGSVAAGKEQPLDDETRLWTGATEVYTLNEGTASHTLTVDIDVLDEHVDFMNTTFPKALEVVKRKCC